MATRRCMLSINSNNTSRGSSPRCPRTLCIILTLFKCNGQIPVFATCAVPYVMCVVSNANEAPHSRQDLAHLVAIRHAPALRKRRPHARAAPLVSTSTSLLRGGGGGADADARRVAPDPSPRQPRRVAVLAANSVALPRPAVSHPVVCGAAADRVV